MITNVKEKQQEYKKRRGEEWNKEVLGLFEQFKKMVMKKIDYIEDTVSRDDNFLMFFIYNTSTKILSCSQKEQFSDLIKTIDLGEIRLVFEDISVQLVKIMCFFMLLFITYLQTKITNYICMVGLNGLFVLLCMYWIFGR